MERTKKKRDPHTSRTHQVVCVVGDCSANERPTIDLFQSPTINRRSSTIIGGDLSKSYDLDSTSIRPRFDLDPRKTTSEFDASRERLLAAAAFRTDAPTFFEKKYLDIFWSRMQGLINHHVAKNIFTHSYMIRNNNWSSVKVLPTELLRSIINRGKRSIDYPAQGNPYNSLPPCERGDLWGVGTVYHTHAYTSVR